MNLLNKKLTVALMSVLTLGACTNENDYSVWETGEVAFENTNIKVMGSRATADAAFENGDQVGILMNMQGNHKYNVNAEGQLSPANEPMKWTSDVTTANFIAYYPFTNSVNEGKVDITLGNTPVLYAKKVETASGEKVKFQFAYATSAVKFSLKANKADANLDDISVVIKNVNKAAKLNLEDGAVVEASNPEDVTMEVVNGKAFSYIFPTQESTSLTIEVTKGGEKSTTSLPNALVFNPGDEYNFALTVKLSEDGEKVMGISFADATINPLNPVDGGEINVNFNETTTPDEPATTEDPTTEDPTTPSVGEKEIFVETFGNPEGKQKPSINDYQGYDIKTNTYNDPFFDGEHPKATVRKTSSLDGHVYLAAKGKFPSHTALRVSGFPANLKNVKLTFDFCQNSTGLNLNNLKFQTNVGTVELPDMPMKRNEYQTVTINLQNDIEWFQFEADNLADGVRIDNLKLVAGGEATSVDATGGDTPASGDATGGDTPASGETTGGDTPASGETTGGDTPASGETTGGDTPASGETTGGDTPATVATAEVVYTQDFSTTKVVEKKGKYFPPFTDYVSMLNTPAEVTTSGKYLTIGTFNKNNSIYFAAKHNNWAEFANIDVRGAKKVKLTAVVSSTMDKEKKNFEDLSRLQVIVAGQTYTFPSVTPTSYDGKELTIDNIVVGADKLTIRFNVAENTTVAGLRLEQFQIETIVE